MENLDIIGHNERTISNTLLRTTEKPGPTAIVLPGLRYNVDMPMLYYATGILIEAGYGVLSVDTRYSSVEGFMSASDKERAEWMFKDAEAVFHAVNALEGCKLSVLVGKSLGTIMIGHLIHAFPEMDSKKVLWLTPLIQNSWVLGQMIAHKGRSFVVIGTADPNYSDESVAKLTEKGRCEVMVVTQGNHSLDVPGGVLVSMEQLKSIMEEFKRFIN